MSLQTVKSIDGIKFCVWPPNEIRKYSVAEITAPETYDEDGMAVQGGLMDGRLGTLEPGQKCLTCGNTSARCPGHFGHIELAEPVLHIAFIDNIHKLLITTCRSCSRIRISEEDLKKLYEYRQRNWKKVHMFRGDISNRDDVLKAFHSRPDIVIHLASYPRAKIVNANPMLGTRNIIEGTVNLLWHCTKMNIKKFIFVKYVIIWNKSNYCSIF